MADASSASPPVATEQIFDAPAWSPDGGWIAVVGHRHPAKAGSRGDVWRFRATPQDRGEDLTADADLFADAGMNSDLLGAGGSAIHWSGDGRWITFAAPIEGSYELWRVEVETRRIERLTEDRHFLYGADQAAVAGGARVASACVTATRAADIVVHDLPAEPLTDGARDRRPPLDRPDGRGLGRHRAGRARSLAGTRPTSDGSRAGSCPPRGRHRAAPSRSCSRSTVARRRSTAGR